MPTVMRPMLTWQRAKPGLSDLLSLLWLAALILVPILISELLYSTLN
jgi:hypothetical protein